MNRILSISILTCILLSGCTSSGPAPRTARVPKEGGFLRVVNLTNNEIQISFQGRSGPVVGAKSASVMEKVKPGKMKVSVKEPFQAEMEVDVKSGELQSVVVLSASPKDWLLSSNEPLPTKSQQVALVFNCLPQPAQVGDDTISPSQSVSLMPKGTLSARMGPSDFVVDPPAPENCPASIFLYMEAGMPKSINVPNRISMQVEATKSSPTN